MVIGSGRPVASATAVPASANRKPPWVLPRTSQPSGISPLNRCDSNRASDGVCPLGTTAQSCSNIPVRQHSTGGSVQPVTSENSPFTTAATQGASAEVVVIVGNPQANSRTRAVGELVGRKVASLTSHPEDVLVVDLADLGPSLLGWGDPTVGYLKEAMVNAQLLVVVSPTFKATYTGLLKLFLDQIERDELGGVTTIPVMTGASAEHSLAVEMQLRPVLVEIGASCPTRGVYLHGEQINNPGPAIDAWFDRNEAPLGRIVFT
ncbi:MAG: NADPH-dependent oxidoreductase [Actinobacteria bacterium]|nr:NADPH-dependent oxidoreductase [Actinomycetota bacterium]